MTKIFGVPGDFNLVALDSIEDHPKIGKLVHKLFLVELPTRAEPMRTLGVLAPDT